MDFFQLTIFEVCNLLSLQIPYIGSMVAWYICLHEWLFFYGLHVGKYTSPMDAMGISKMMFYIQSVVLHVGVSSNSGTPKTPPK